MYGFYAPHIHSQRKEVTYTQIYSYLYLKNSYKTFHLCVYLCIVFTETALIFVSRFSSFCMCHKSYLCFAHEIHLNHLKSLRTSLQIHKKLFFFAHLTVVLHISFNFTSLMCPSFFLSYFLLISLFTFNLDIFTLSH